MDCILYSFQQVAWEALSRVISSVPKEVLPSYVKLVRDAVSTSRDRERRKKKVRSSLDDYLQLILWFDKFQFFVCLDVVPWKFN